MKLINQFIGGVVMSVLVFSAIAVFAAADNVVIASVGAQVGVVEYGTAGSATFSITATGDAAAGEVDWSISGVPGGVSAGFSDNPSISSSTWSTTLTLGTTAIVNPGVYTMTITADGDGVGVDDTDTVTFVVSPRTISAAGLTASDKEYDNTMAATVTGTLSEVINGDTVTATGAFADELAGTNKVVNLTLAGADASKYVSTSTLTASITKKDVSITAGDFATNGRPYNGTTLAELRAVPTGLVLSGVVPGDVLSVGGGVGTFATKHVGTAKVVTFSGFTATGTDAANYNLVGQPVNETQNVNPQAITVRPVNDTKVYDGATSSALIPTVTNGALGVGDTGSFTQAFDTPTVGTGKSVVSMGTVNDGNGGANYIITHQPRTNSAITPRDVFVTNLGVNDKIYDGTTTATLAVGGTLSGVVGNDVVSAVFTGATAIFDTEDAGTGKAVAVTGVTLTGLAAGNYAVVQPTTTGTILPRPISITAVTDLKAYDATTTSAGIPQLTAGTLVLGDSAVYSQVFATKQAGAGKSMIPSAVITDGAGGNNYIVTAIPVATGEITPIPLVITATGVHKVYDGTATATVSFTDTRIADDVFTATGTAVFDTEDVGTGKTITVTDITLDGADAGNYVPNPTTTATADITPRTLTVTITGNDKVYDGNRLATIATSDDRIAGDDLTIIYPITGPDRPRFNNRFVAVGKTVTVASLTSTGTDAINYVLGNTSASDTSVDITPAPLVVGFVADDKMYDATTTAMISSSTIITSIVSGDIVTLTPGTAVFADKMVGTGKVVTGAGFTLGGTHASNYSIVTIATTTATITPRMLVVTATGTSKVYDGTFTATVGYADDRIAGDVLTITGSSSFQSNTVATGITIDIANITLDGVDAGNYVPNATTTATADITPRDLAVTIVALDKVVDGSTVAMVVYNDNRVTGDDVTVSGTASFADALPGAAKLVTATSFALTGLDQGNYSFLNTVATSTATITEAVRRSSGGSGSRPRVATTTATTTPAGAVLGAATTTPGFQFLVDMRVGSTHPDVFQLQTRLMAEGLLNIPAPTGYFGPMTLAAVQAYQAAHPEIGYVTGFCGPLTRAVLNK